MTVHRVWIATHSEELPANMACTDFFHSVELFRIVEQTPGQTPYMAIAEDDKGRILGHILASIRRRGRLFPPYYFTQGRIYGKGEYAADADANEVFGLLLAQLTKTFRRKLCLFVEFSDVAPKMFGYRHFRRNEYFPIHWQEVHNSLHSLPPEQRLSAKMRLRIKQAYANGVVTMEAESEELVAAFYKMLRGFYRMKIRRIIPGIQLFYKLHQSHNARIFVTQYRDKIIGGCACVYSGRNAYLWYLASKRKTHHSLHPDVMTVWQAITHAHANHYDHIYFLDVGLPFRRNPFREFILSFGGKPVARYRWFRIFVPWVNNILSWWYTG